MDSRYSLAVLASKRAHQIEAGDVKMLSEYKSPKPLGQALEEIAAGDIIIDPDSMMLEKDAERIDNEEKHEEDK
ncbi:hypothetical protein IV40_GL000129 [Lactobacillus selangorensis]|uniref:DNA-directed RNA polymerase subunit omega n=1 Tax=Lactobacillus selangorensis TaxID=81857 RepID=A0A0R2G1U5_9LACO|nr:hypothetical protein IV40_GL000129 [Lactobacillus selangorensis]